MGRLVPIKLAAGIRKNFTRFAGEGGWYDGDKIRFFHGLPEAIGGWVRYTRTAFLGTCRSLTQWTWLDGNVALGFGTTVKYYIYTGSIDDITPIRRTSSVGAVTFAATNGSTTITVTDVGNGVVLGDFVTFSGAVTLGGTITADILNAEHVVTSIAGDDFTITASVAANASDTGNGGASVVGTYQINIGLDTSFVGTGFGSDPWSDGVWGAGGSSAVTAELRLWEQDNFGEDLVFNVRGGGVYYWDRTTPTVRGVALSDLSGANLAPTLTNQVLVSDQDRHVVCFGADPEDDIGTFDPLLIRWSDQENVSDWQTLTTNTSGSIRLSRGSQIVKAVQTKREIAVFTDASLHSMQFIGPPYTFGIQLVASGIKLVGPNAVVAARDTVYWMESGKFMKYDGNVTTVECSVEGEVFEDINLEEAKKIYCGHNVLFSEIWWFYPSASATENDRYVLFNYDEGTWAYGTMARTAWLSAGTLDKPLAASTDGYIYSHEFGFNDGSTSPESPLNSYIESSSLDIAEGDSFFFANRVIPDLTFGNSTDSPMAEMTIKAKRTPGAAYNDSNDSSVFQTSTVPIEQFTEMFHIRLRGRSFAVRVEANQTNTWWRLGVPRIEIRTDGRK